METCSLSDFMRVLNPWLDAEHIRRAYLDDKGNFVQGKCAIDDAFRVGKHGEGNFELLRIFGSAFLRIAQNDENVRARVSEVFNHAPQLGDMRSALHSVVFAHEEKHNPRLAAVVDDSRFSALVGWQSESRGS